MPAAFVRATPSVCTPGSSGSYVDVDLDSYGLETSAVGAWIHIEATNLLSSKLYDIRCNGSTDTAGYQLLAKGSHCLVYKGVDANGIVEIKLQVAADADVTMLGSLMSPVVMFTNMKDYSTSTTDFYVDTDVSSDCPDAKMCLLSLLRAPTGISKLFVRKNGSSDDRYATADIVYSGSRGHIVGLDAAQIFEQKIESTYCDCYVSGYYAGSAVTMHTNATDRSLGSTGSWIDLTALPSGALSGFYSQNSISGALRAAIRKNGEADDPYGFNINSASWMSWIVECDGDRLVEGKIASTYIDFYELGYAELEPETLRPNAAGDETAITTQSPASTAHWDKVDEAVADDFTTYLGSVTGSYQRDLYNLPASSGSGTINKITVFFRCYLSASYAKASIKAGSTVSDGAEKSTFAWNTHSEEWALNPDDSEAWAWADIDALQIGVSLKGFPDDDNAYCTQVYVEVDYTEIDAPTVTTQAVDTLVPGGGTLNGNITDDGGGSITQHGFCWKAGSDPVNIAGADGSSELGVGTEGAFDQAKAGLTEATAFYVRSYATNSEGTSYGAAVSFTTGQTHSGVVAITPAVGVESVGNYICIAACPVSPAVGVESIGNYICIAACPVSPAVGVAAKGNYICIAACPVGPAVDIAAVGNYICIAACPITPTVGLAIEGNRVALGACPIDPAVGIAIEGNRIAGGACLIAPAVGVAAVGNYICIAACPITPTVGLAIEGNRIALGVCPIDPAVGIAIEGNRIADGACPVGPAVGLSIEGNRIAVGACPIAPAVGVEVVGNYICIAACPIAPAVGLAIEGNRVALGVCPIDPAVGIAIEGNRLADGACPIGPAVGLSIEGNRIAVGACPIGVALSLTAEGNRIAIGACPITPSLGIEVIANFLWNSAASAIGIEMSQTAIGNRIASGACPIGISLVLALTGDRFSLATVNITPTVGLSLTAGVIRDAAIALTPAVDLAIAANYITLAAAAIGVTADLTAIGNRIAGTGVDISAAVSLAAVANAIRRGVVGITPEVALAAAAVLESSGVVSLTPEVDVESIANFLWGSASAAIGPAVELVSAANRIASAAVDIGPGADLVAIGSRLSIGEVDITAAVSLAAIAGIIRDGHTDISVATAVASAAISLRSGVVAITPAVGLVVAGIRLASAVVAITPEVDVAVVGNYITCAVAAIAVAVSQEAICIRVMDGGTVSISIDATVAAVAIRYMVQILGYSGEFGAGSVIEIDTEWMTFKVDGANMLKDMVGDFVDVQRGDSTVTYEDDEGTRDVTLKLKYTPRDA